MLEISKSGCGSLVDLAELTKTMAMKTRTTKTINGTIISSVNIIKNCKAIKDYLTGCWWDLKQIWAETWLWLIQTALYLFHSLSNVSRKCQTATQKFEPWFCFGILFWFFLIFDSKNFISLEARPKVAGDHGMSRDEERKKLFSRCDIQTGWGSDW